MTRGDESKRSGRRGSGQDINYAAALQRAARATCSCKLRSSVWTSNTSSVGFQEHGIRVCLSFLFEALSAGVLTRCNLMTAKPGSPFLEGVRGVYYTSTAA